MTRPVLYRCIDAPWVWTRPFHFYYSVNILSTVVHHFTFSSIRHTLCMLNILHFLPMTCFCLARFTELSVVGVASVGACGAEQTLACPPLAMRKSILRNPQEQVNHTRGYSPHAAQPAPAPRFASARASYPVFLSFYDTLKLQIGWAWRGFVDAFRWDVVIGLMTRNVCFLPFRFCLSMSSLVC